MSQKINHVFLKCRLGEARQAHARSQAKDPQAKQSGKWTTEKCDKQPNIGVKFQNACKFIMPLLTVGFVVMFFIVAFNNPQWS